MGLQTLEFSDCLVDSPYFRDKLHQHEKELERTSKSIKHLIAECKDLLSAARNLSRAQRNFSKILIDFKFETIGDEQTDDEMCIAESLKEFGKLIAAIEDERDRMLDQAFIQFVQPLESFRKEQIGGAKEDKKKFDKMTAKFCQSLERHLNMKANRATEVALKEADAQLEFEKREFYKSSMQHVLLLQEVQERKKFEFVEILLSFMYSWLTFYHQGQEVAKDYRPYMTDLQLKLQKMRAGFDSTRDEAEQLMKKMLEVRGRKPENSEIISQNKLFAREGYLYLMEKKTIQLGGPAWNKYFCQYMKDTKQLIMTPYSQTTAKPVGQAETLVLTSCTRRASESIDKRFCFDITVQDRPGSTMTLQAVSEQDRRLWLDAMDGKEPIYNKPQVRKDGVFSSDMTDYGFIVFTCLDKAGFHFIDKCISALDSRGMTEQGLYRVVGVASKVAKLTQMGLDPKKVDKINLDDEEIKTITSAIKSYFRSLPEPLMTFDFHQKFIAAAKQESKTLRIHDIHVLIHKLPEPNFKMLEVIIRHLRRVADQCNKNLMNVANIGVCFGPTLMRPIEETLASIIEIKFCNVVVEILINYHEKIFFEAPEGADVTDSKAGVIQKPKHISENMSSSMYERPSTEKLGPAGQDRMSVSMTAVPPEKMSRSFQDKMSESVTSSMASSLASMDSSTTSIEDNAKTPTSGSGPPYSNFRGTPPVKGLVSSGNSAANSGNNNSGNYAQFRRQLRPVGIYHPNSSDICSSTSSSSESLNSKSSATQSNASICSNTMPASTTGAHLDDIRKSKPIYTNLAKEYLCNRRLLVNSVRNPTYEKPLEIIPSNKTPGVNRAFGRKKASRSSAYEVPGPSQGGGPNKAETIDVKKHAKTFGFRKRKSRDRDSLSSLKSSTSSISSTSSSLYQRCRKVRTLYACEAENDTELSFEPNQIIYNVKQSREVGWLEGTLNGKTGLIPANYVEYLN
ncbi:rho GTPase-activating protein 26-like isoform X4 [Lineus longissimus]|uniref:rho GTPase-activating protein 26-like isoform X4 n=1 Tax=Lineus longissimus TaxID=88925 RepID=UPI00315D2A22